VQSGPPDSWPVTQNFDAVALGSLVSPGEMVKCPVGAVAVPPHVQVVPVGGGDGLALAAVHHPIGTKAAAAATNAIRRRFTSPPQTLDRVSS
jgi:hypothetical protein